MTDYSTMSDEELLGMYQIQQNGQSQPPPPQTDYSSMSDADLLNAYNQQQSSQVPSPTEQAALTHSGPAQVTNYQQPSWKNTVSQIARPVLQAGGMVAGGLVGAPLAPETLGASSVAGAALGYAGGEQVANKLDEALGLRQAQPVGQELLQAGKDIGTGAALEMGGQVLGKAIPMAAKGIGKMISQPLGVATGTGGGAIEEAFGNNPGFRQGISGAINEQDLVGQVNNKLDGLVQSRAEAYQNALKNVQGATQNLDVAPIEKTLADRFKIFGLKLEKALPEELQGINLNIPKNKAIIDGIMADVKPTLSTAGARGAQVADIGQAATKVLEDFKTVGDNSPYGLDTLRMNLQAIAQDSPKARVMLRPVIEDIRNTVETAVPGYKDMLSGYEAATNKINEIQKSLSIRGEGVSQDSLIRKLSTIFRDVNKYRLGQIDELDPNGDLRAQIAGVAMRSGLPRGQLTRMIGMGSVGGVGMLTHNPALVVGLSAISSPRLVGETANAMGKAYNAIPPGVGEAVGRTGMLNYLGGQNSRLSPSTGAINKIIPESSPLKRGVVNAMGEDLNSLQDKLKTGDPNIALALMTMPQVKSTILSNKAAGKAVFEGIPPEDINTAMQGAESARAVASTQAQTFHDWAKDVVSQNKFATTEKPVEAIKNVLQKDYATLTENEKHFVDNVMDPAYLKSLVPAIALPLQKLFPKQLDSKTAQAILEQAGGDKDKARAIAKQRGYKF